MGVALALASMLCFATNILVSRYAMARMGVDSGFFLVLATSVLAGAAVFAIELAWRAAPFLFQPWPALVFSGAGLIGAFLGRRLLYDTVRQLGPARTSVFHSCAPVPTLFFAWVIVGETLGAYELALMVIVTAGLWITHPPQKDGAAAAADRARLRKGALFGLLMITGFGASNALRGLAVRDWNEPLFGAVLGSLVALAGQVVATRDWGGVARGFREAKPGGMALYAASGVLTLGGATLILEAMKHMEIALAALITHTTPLVIFPVSVFLYRNREGLTPRTFAGVALVLLGIALLALR